MTTTITQTEFNCLQQCRFASRQLHQLRVAGYSTKMLDDLIKRGLLSKDRGNYSTTDSGMTIIEAREAEIMAPKPERISR